MVSISNRIINFNKEFLLTMGGSVGFVVFNGNPRIAIKVGPYHVSLDFAKSIERGYRLDIHHKRKMHKMLAKIIFRIVEPIALSVVDLIREYHIVIIAGFDPDGYPRIVYYDKISGEYYMYLEEEQKIISVIKE